MLSPDDTANAARLCLAAYDESPDVSGWEPIRIEDLDIPEGYEPDGRYINENAFAFVRTMEVDGKRTLALVFKGTDKWCYRDWKDNVLNINTHYEKMRPLIEALDRYVEKQNIDRVMVCGHSLGGAMAAIYMEEHQESETGIQYAGVSFGSPGGIFPDGYIDRRMICFRHEQDPVPHVASMRAKIGLGYRWPGRIMEIRDAAGLRFKGLLGRFKAHSMKEYLATIEHLVHERIFEVALKAERDVLMLSGAPDPDQDSRVRILSELPDLDLEGGALSDEDARELDAMVDQAHEMDRQELEQPSYSF